MTIGQVSFNESVKFLGLPEVWSIGLTYVSNSAIP